MSSKPVNGDNSPKKPSESFKQVTDAVDYVVQQVATTARETFKQIREQEEADSLISEQVGDLINAIQGRVAALQPSNPKMPVENEIASLAETKLRHMWLHNQL